MTRKADRTTNLLAKYDRRVPQGVPGASRRRHADDSESGRFNAFYQLSTGAN
jgi:hypothetical protein